MSPIDVRAQQVLDKLSSLRQHQRDGRRSPHKPLLMLLALGRLAAKGTSALTWAEAEEQLADLLEEFGPISTAGRAQSAAYPFTRLRSDAVWTLDRDVPMDNVGPLRDGVIGRLEASLEAALQDRPELLDEAARTLVLRQALADGSRRSRPSTEVPATFRSWGMFLPACTSTC